MFFLLLRPKLLSLKNSISTSVLLRQLPFLLLGAGFWILFSIGSYKVISYIRSLPIAGEILSGKLISMTFFSLTGFLILSNIITAISSFYISKDISFLFSKPLEIRDIIRLKTFETVLNSSWMVMAFVPPLLFSYGLSYQASSSYYLAALVFLFLFLLVNAGIGITLAHILTRLFPAKKTRNALLGAGIILLISLYFAVQSIIPQDLNTPEDLISRLSSFRTDSPLLPDFWVTAALLPMLNNRGPDTFYSLVLLINSAFFLLFSEMAGIWLYKNNVERLQPASGEYGRGIFSRVYPAGNMALLYKDAKTFFRDTGQWSQVFIIAALVLVYVYNFRSVPIGDMSELSPFIKELLLLINMVMAGLVLSAVSARFLYTSVSLEGQAFWVIRTSPVDIRGFLWSKFVYGCIPVAALIVLLVFLTNLAMQISRGLMLASLATTLLLCISVCGLGTGLGAMYPKFRHENIASVSMSLGGMAFMLIAFSVVIITLSLEAYIFYLLRIRAGMQEVEKTLLIAASLLLLLSVNAAAFWAPMKLGAKRLQLQG